MEELINDQQDQNHSPDTIEPEASDNSLEDSLQRYEAQRAVLEKILETIPVESGESASNKNTNKQSILQRMKRILHLILLLALMIVATNVHAQDPTRGTSSILFQEDFNGWTSGSIAANGWSTITSSYNYIDPQDNAINFFKQETAQWMLLIMPGLDLTNANMLIFDFQRGSSVAGQKIKIGVMTNPTNTSTFTMLDIVDVNSMEWQTDTIFLSGITGTQYLAFNAEGPTPYTYFFRFRYRFSISHSNLIRTIFVPIVVVRHTGFSHLFVNKFLCTICNYKDFANFATIFICTHY